MIEQVFIFLHWICLLLDRCLYSDTGLNFGGTGVLTLNLTVVGQVPFL